MAELSEIRKEINRIDAALKPLLKQRMDCAAAVAESKLVTANQTKEPPVIFVGPREEEILSAVDAAEHTTSVRHLMKEIMGISRRHQYRLLYQKGAFTDRFGEYTAGTISVLPLAEGKLTEALQIIARYAVTVCAADGKQITLCADEAEEMQVLRIQLQAEGYLK